jgi:hypothetical protein
VWDADPVRGAQTRTRLITVAVIVLSTLALIALAARSDRAPTLTPMPVVPTPTAFDTAAGTVTPAPNTDQTESPNENDQGSHPDWALWFAAALFVAPLLIALFYAPAMLSLPAGGRWFDRRPLKPAEPAEAEDEVTPPPLADAIAEGLRELDQGGPGEGVVACWVQLERAAADAGTHRAAPDTASELAGRLIDRHPVSSGPLLRLVDLYREARYSRHQLPESARTEARAALEQLRAELEANPVGSR